MMDVERRSSSHASPPPRSAASAAHAVLLSLEGEDGRAARVVRWSGAPARVIRRRDTGRIEVRARLDDLLARGVRFEDLGALDDASLRQGPARFAGGVRLRALDATRAQPALDAPSGATDEGTRGFVYALAGVALAACLFGLLLMRAWRDGVSSAPPPPQLAKIVQAQPPPPPPKREAVPPAPEPVVEAEPQKTAAPVAKPEKSLKRLGALGILGQLSKNKKQVGGLDLGAAKTTAGAGLGGDAGSGGAQGATYAQGLVAAPVGPGANVQGGGGYGTKGKGGGQAGYGELKLVGGAGAAQVPLGRAQSVTTGLSRQAIEAAIAKYLGQVRFCYEQSLQSDPSLAGRVAVAFVIGGVGRVTSAALESSTARSPSVESCIVERLKTWAFPTPAGGVDVRVSYPFVLRRMGQG